MDNTLSESFKESLDESAVSIVAGLAEAGIDSILDEGLLNKVPIVSTVFSLYKFGNGIRERYNLIKISRFLNEINSQIVDEEKRNSYIKIISDEPKKRSKEIEYLLILIDRYLEKEKPEMLAKLYLAYLRGELSWNTFSQYSVIIGEFLPGDYQAFCRVESSLMHPLEVPAPYLRLASLGLLVDSSEEDSVDDTSLILAGNRKRYLVTEFGNNLKKILNSCL
ncbi:MAG: hypothetical protein IKH03_05915 [Oscillospiraceae bacterium]|nr:hypothetical protein [Oscillospiraceae bacterium]